MKKGILILLGMFLMVSTVEAKNGNYLPTTVGVYSNYNNAVSFFERGIQFHVFLNGDFDFDSRRNNIYYDYNGRRGNINNVTVRRDYRGRITRVGNSRISYDFRGNVDRIGSVSMRYNFGNLTRVGGLRVTYDRFGDVYFYGQVRNTNFYTDRYGLSFNLNLGTVCTYNDPYFYRNDFRNNYSQIREDANFYYYRANKNARIGSRNKILKRRKQASKRTERTVRKKVNNTYKRKNVSDRNTVKRDVKDRSNNRKNVTTRNKVTRDSKVITTPKRTISNRNTPTRTTSTRTTTPKRATSTRTTQKKATPTKRKTQVKRTVPLKSKTKRKVATRTTKR